MIHIPLRPLALGALLLAAIVPPAAAQAVVLRHGSSADPTDPSKIVREAVVSLSDIDPTSPSGAQTLLRRIEEAADGVCGGAAYAVTDSQKEAFAMCRSSAISGAVAKMRSPALTALVSHRQAELRATR